MSVFFTTKLEFDKLASLPERIVDDVLRGLLSRGVAGVEDALEAIDDEDDADRVEWL